MHIGLWTLEKWSVTQLVPHYTHRPLWPYRSGPRHRWYLITYTVQALDPTEVVYDTAGTSLHTQFKPWTLQKWPETQMVPHYTHRPLGPYRRGLRHRWYLTTHTGPYRGGLWHRQCLTTHIASWTLEKRSSNTGGVYPSARVPQNRFSSTYYTGLQWKQADAGQRYQPSTALTLIRFFFLSLSIFSHDFKNNSTTIKQIL